MELLDSPETTINRKNVIVEKKILYSIYNDWYCRIYDCLPVKMDRILELGTGAGFFKEFITKKKEGIYIISTDVMYIPFLDAIIDGQFIPFPNNSINVITLLNVLHHIPDVIHFFNETMRVLGKGGKVIMIEPWVNTWSLFFYQKFHHEQTNAKAIEWIFESSGPLSGSNQALPWILFHRDLEKFCTLFPQIKINKIQPLMPFSYILSGGFSGSWNFPVTLYKIFRRIETKLSLDSKYGLFALIELEIQ